MRPYKLKDPKGICNFLTFQYVKKSKSRRIAKLKTIYKILQRLGQGGHIFIKVFLMLYSVFWAHNYQEACLMIFMFLSEVERCK